MAYNIRPDDAGEWVRARDRIADLQSRNIPQAKAAEDRKRVAADAEVQALRASVAQKAKQKAKEERDVARIEKKGITRFVARIGGRLDEKVDKEKQEAALAAADLKKVEAELAAAVARHRAILDTVALIAADEAALAAAYEQQTAIVHRVFWGPQGAGDEVEKGMQNEVVLLKPQHDELTRRARDHTRADGHMRKALQLCGDSLHFMQEAMRLCKADLVMNIGRRNGGMAGAMVDIRKQQVLRQAGALLQGAAREVSSAQAFIPEVRPIDPNLVRVMGGFVDVIFDNMITDMLIAKQVQSSTERIQSTYGHLRAGQQWVAHIKRQTDEQYVAVKAQYDGRVNNLRLHRWALLDAAAAYAPVPSSAPSQPPPSAPTPALPVSGHESIPPPPPSKYGEYPPEPTNYKAPEFPGDPVFTRSPSWNKESPF